jgi:hypothetical protein
MAPTAPSSKSTPPSAQPISNHTSPTLAPPAQVEYPDGYDEGVGVSTSQLPHAGRGLYGLRPLPEAPHLFAKQGQLICVYATQRHQISATTATLSSSRYLWSTNTGNRRKARALYFDAQDAPHYGTFINDKWNAHSNNCELRWNPATGRVEVYALRDILLNEEFGADYDAPFWYQRHNGLSTLAQAQQVRTYYQQSKLPWYSARSLPKESNSITISLPTQSPGTQPAQSPESATTPPTESASSSPSKGPSTEGNGPPHEHYMDSPTIPENYMDLTSTQETAPTALSPTAAAQPNGPSPLYLGTNNTIDQQIQDERRTIDRLYGLECGIQSNSHIGADHRFSHPQLYRLCTGGLLTGDIIHAVLDIQNTMRSRVCFRHMDNYVRDPAHSNIPSHRLLKELFSAQLVGLLHNHNGTHWGLSLMLRKGQRLHVIYLDSLNNTYPELDNDLRLFWIRAAHAAQQLRLLSGHAPRATIHHIQLPCQTNNFDCGIFVLAYQRAAQSWINTHLPSAQTSIDQRINTLT